MTFCSRQYLCVSTAKKNPSQTCIYMYSHSVLSLNNNKTRDRVLYPIENIYSSSCRSNK